MTNARVSRVRDNAIPSGGKSRIKALFADERYLRRWPSDLELADARRRATNRSPTSRGSPRRPIAKRAGLALPTTDAMGVRVRGRRARPGSGARSARLNGSRSPTALRPPAIGQVRPTASALRTWSASCGSGRSISTPMRQTGSPRFQRQGQRQLLRRRGGGRRRSDRLSGFHALFDAREPEGGLHRRQSRLSLRGRRAMIWNSLIVAAALVIAVVVAGPAAPRADEHAQTKLQWDGAAPSSASLYNLEPDGRPRTARIVALGSLCRQADRRGDGLHDLQGHLPRDRDRHEWIEKHLPPDVAGPRADSCSSPSIRRPTRRNV